MAAEKKRGRPPHQPTETGRSTVARMVAAGTAVAEIARVIGVAESTLRGHYAAELATPRPQAVLPGVAPPDPQPPRERSGRPHHVPTEESRERVEILVAGGMPAWRIAAAIGCSEPTLREHYADELEHGRARREAEITVSLYRAAREGNVAAMKEWRRTPTDMDAPPPPKEPPLGKKEQQQMEAMTAAANTSWEGLLPH